jgi:hypothetical protein
MAYELFTRTVKPIVGTTLPIAGTTLPIAGTTLPISLTTVIAIHITSYIGQRFTCSSAGDRAINWNNWTRIAN